MATSPPRGFTLIELLVVCSILAALAYTAWGAYIGVEEDSEDIVARSEMLRLVNAIARFHADTGYYPGQGPFALSSSAISEADCSTADGVLRSWADPANDADRDDWFASPANLALLLEAPTLCSKNRQAHLARWNPETGRGWHGPYFDRGVRQWVDHGANLNSGGSPLSGSKIVDVPAYGNGPRFRAAASGDASCTTQASASSGDGCMFGWRTLPRATNGYEAQQHELAAHARPFLVFGTSDGDHPRVVYLGTDGRYGGTNAADPCLPNASTTAGADDVVLCLP
jgi:prepilin-type N-terminal cleavage/methylation domain-containing protein